jgi:hypothetical protein
MTDAGQQTTATIAGYGKQHAASASHYSQTPLVVYKETCTQSGQCTKTLEHMGKMQLPWLLKPTTYNTPSKHITHPPNTLNVGKPVNTPICS